MNRPDAIAAAWAEGRRGSIVAIRAFVMIKSAAAGDGAFVELMNVTSNVYASEAERMHGRMCRNLFGRSHVPQHSCRDAPTYY